MISTKFIRFSFDKLARTHKIARSFSPRVLVPKPVPTGSAYVTHAPQEPHFGSDNKIVYVSGEIGAYQELLCELWGNYSNHGNEKISKTKNLNVQHTF